jgi:hypothetical protein
MLAPNLRNGTFPVCGFPGNLKPDSLDAASSARERAG